MTIEHRISRLDWDRIGDGLRANGWATTGPLLDLEERRDLIDGYDNEDRFRSRVVMARHGFGRGEYRYYAYPLPPLIHGLRASLYEQLVGVANEWQDGRFPPTHADYVLQCHEQGQCRPTPLQLRYGPGDYNCLHQDLYGAEHFPLQAAILLSDPERDFAGGELVLTEQRPRMQSRASVVPLRAGEAAIFAVHHRPVQGTRGTYRVAMRHGVSEVRDGKRHVLGIIMHDAA